MENRIDLHIHTCYSDGELTPMQVVNLAVKKELNIIAITDHDSVEGLKLVDREDPLIKDGRIEVINGIELSAKTSIGKMHILGHGIDYNNKELCLRLEEVRRKNIEITLAIYEQIKKDYGICFSDEEIEELKRANHNIGRPDLAKLCIKHGFAASVSEAFEKFLIPAHDKLQNIDVSKGIDWHECLDLIRNSGGVSVLAHPKTLKLNDEELKALLERMVSYGLQGIEVYNPIHTEEETRKYLEYASLFKLLISGGSDYHGEHVKPDIQLGSGIGNNLKIKELSLVDYLHKKDSN